MQKPFPRILYQDAMEQYGVDRPDIRYDLRAIDISDIAGGSGFQVFVSFDDVLSLSWFQICLVCLESFTICTFEFSHWYSTLHLKYYLQRKLLPPNVVMLS